MRFDNNGKEVLGFELFVYILGIVAQNVATCQKTANIDSFLPIRGNVFVYFYREASYLGYAHIIAHIC